MISRIHGDTQPTPWVEPAITAAASTPSATYGVRPCRTGSLVSTAVMQAATIATTSSNRNVTWAGPSPRFSSGPSTRTGNQISTPA